MKKLILGCLVAGLVLVACNNDETSGPAAAANDTGRLNASGQLATLVAQYFEKRLELNPLSATQIGDHRFDDRLANRYGPEYIAATEAMNAEFLQRLLEIDESVLAGQDWLTYEAFKLSRENAIAGQQFPAELQPVNQFYSAPKSFVQLGSGAAYHPFKSVRNYDDFLSRIDDYVVLNKQLIENMKLGMQQGIVQPRILMEKVLPQLASQVVENVQDSLFYLPIKNLPDDFNDDDRQRLTAAYTEAIRDKIIPAYQLLGDFIRDEYLSAARESTGLSALPNGKAWYAYMVKLRTTTDLTPDEIHQIGLDEVARIHEEMRGVMEEVDFEGDLKDFFEFLNSDERFYFDEPEQLIQGYRDMSEHIASLAPKLFSIFPKTGFEVRRVEPFREKSGSGGSYNRGTPDGSRPGIFYANAYDIKARPIWAMESLFLHEAIPGHHFQISIQQEQESLPEFRRFGGYTAFSEGWGLYAESLGKELGVYTDPYQYFGALNAELWRALRLVVDTGLHAKGWSRQDVLDYMYANSAVKEARAVSETERFIAIPGQALAYKIGQLKIRELRDRAEDRLGSRFDLRAFHSVILIDGALPLSLLEMKVDRWIADQL
jgi:uncharacterized protein (DUF885 family)